MESGKLWLKDFLPEKLPEARIMSFGYDSKVFSKSAADIDDVAVNLLDRLNNKRTDVDSKRPVLFVAHSLGGIVVKKAGYP